MTHIRRETFPKGSTLPNIIGKIVEIFERAENINYNKDNSAEYRSDAILSKLHSRLTEIGFAVESNSVKNEKGKVIEKSIRVRKTINTGMGDNNIYYNIDAYNAEFRCGLEIEAGRGWKSNAVYRKIIQAMLTPDMDHIVIAVRNEYTSKKEVSRDYEKTVRLCSALYHNKLLPERKTISVIGYGAPSSQSCTATVEPTASEYTITAVTGRTRR